MNLQNHHKTSQQMADSLGMGVGSEEGLQRSVDPTPPHPHLWAVHLGSHSEPRSSAFLLPLSDRVEVDAISKAKLSLVRRRQSNATQQAFTTEDSQALPAPLWTSLLENTPTTRTTPLACINVFGVSGCDKG